MTPFMPRQLAADVHDMAALDSGFAALPARLMRIYTDRGRARRCRELRAR
jgi:hypothetical protein